MIILIHPYRKWLTTEATKTQPKMSKCIACGRVYKYDDVKPIIPKPRTPKEQLRSVSTIKKRGRAF